MANRREREKQQRRKSDAQAWAKQQGRGFDSTCIKLPEGVEFYKLEPGTHLVDFMPYVAGKNNPRADEGMEHFERTYEGHRVPTSDGNQLYGCRSKNFGKRCYICDWMRDNARIADPELLKTLRHTTRHLWLVNDKPGDKKNPLKILDTNHFNRGMGFGEMMADAIISVPEYASFADLQGGMTLQLTVKEQTFPGGKYNAVTRIDFRPRKYSYPDELLDSAPCLDECLILVSNEALQKALGQEEPDEGDQDDSSSRSTKPARESSTKGKDHDFEAGDMVVFEGDTYSIKRLASDGSLVLEDEDGVVTKGVDPEEVEKAPPKKVGKKPVVKDEDEDDVKPASKGSKSKAKDEDEDLEDEDEDED